MIRLMTKEERETITKAEGNGYLYVMMFLIPIFIFFPLIFKTTWVSFGFSFILGGFSILLIVKTHRRGHPREGDEIYDVGLARQNWSLKTYLIAKLKGLKGV